MTPEQIQANQKQREFIGHLAKVMTAAQKAMDDKQYFTEAGKSDEWQEGARAMFETISRMLMPAVSAEVQRLIMEAVTVAIKKQGAEGLKDAEAIDKSVDENGVNEAAEFLRKFTGPAH